MYSMSPTYIECICHFLKYHFIFFVGWSSTREKEGKEIWSRNVTIRICASRKTKASRLNSKQSTFVHTLLD